MTSSSYSFQYSAARWLALCAAAGSALAATGKEPSAPAGTDAPPAQQQPTIYIREFRVLGTKELPKIDVEETVYPFLGPGRTFKDIEDAAAALTKAYQDKGFKAAQVVVPEQDGRGGVVNLQAYEGKVGSLRITGAKYFLPSHIRAQARSLAEGKVINFNNIGPEIVKLNGLPDRRVEPKLTPSLEPGIYDIELAVKDNSPLHGSIELNNRNSPNTTDLRLNASISYANLWQRGHTLGASYQMSPEDRSEVKVFSAFYMLRMPQWDSFSLMLNGTKQDSNVSTLGGAAVAGRGEILGMKGIFTLPSMDGFFHSLSVGFDYKNFDQNVIIAGATDVTPISYYPVNATWDGTWVHSKEVAVPTDTDANATERVETGTTELTVGLTVGLRGTGSTQTSLERNRFGADGNFIYIRGSLAHTQKLPKDWELYAKIHGQAGDQPLVNSEQFSGGGIGTARGYLEAEAQGDSGLFTTIELRTPSLLPKIKKGGDPKNADDETGHEWRFYGFFDAGTLTLHDALPSQASSFRLASAGFGSEIRLWNHFSGMLEFALPLTSLSNTKAHDPRVNFRVGSDF